ncbi:hypothetical protein PVAP13_5KG086387 [Panicum virgatum]|uniref:Uncharacterized protein n=1 Tax=Panicum virgatum TaxID=38727 RepID=A0A8T0SAI3_PANVG|nr:hypothetical protein PVAP13_5KG086387 [Panicum virgatum]
MQSDSPNSRCAGVCGRLPQSGLRSGVSSTTASPARALRPVPAQPRPPPPPAPLIRFGWNLEGTGPDSAFCLNFAFPCGSGLLVLLLLRRTWIWHRARRSWQILTHGFQKMDKSKAANRHTRQLKELTDKMSVAHWAYSCVQQERALLLKHRSTDYEENIQYEVYGFKYLWMQSGCAGASSSMLCNGLAAYMLYQQMMVRITNDFLQPEGTQFIIGRPILLVWLLDLLASCATVYRGCILKKIHDLCCKLYTTIL